eukprot:1181952-Prorocentrum_minimum.AAC.3
MEEAVPSVTKDVKQSATASVGAPNPRFTTRTPASAGMAGSQWEGLKASSSTPSPAKQPAPSTKTKPDPGSNPPTSRSATPAPGKLSKATTAATPANGGNEGGLPILPVVALVALGILAKVLNFEARPSLVQGSVIKQMKRDKGMWK